jgi:hypothetical protein
MVPPTALHTSAAVRAAQSPGAAWPASARAYHEPRAERDRYLQVGVRVYHPKLPGTFQDGADAGSPGDNDRAW